MNNVGMLPLFCYYAAKLNIFFEKIIFCKHKNAGVIEK